jgi:hypothetical protein
LIFHLLRTALNGWVPLILVLAFGHQLLTVGVGAAEVDRIAAIEDTRVVSKTAVMIIVRFVMLIVLEVVRAINLFPLSI